MGVLNEKLAYLEGYLEGLELSDETKEGKALYAIIDLLETIVEESEEMQENLGDLEQLGEELDEDLGQLEEFIFDGACECGCEDEDDDEDYDFGELVYSDEDEEEAEEENGCGCGCGE
jgi:hypothetical protein